MVWPDIVTLRLGPITDHRLLITGLRCPWVPEAGASGYAVNRPSLITESVVTNHFSDSSVSPLATVKLGNRFDKICSLKIRPERLGHIHLGVAQLPK